MLKGGDFIYASEKSVTKHPAPLPCEIAIVGKSNVGIVNEIIKGHCARKTRFRKSGLEFDGRALAAVCAAISSIGADISDDTARARLQNKVFDSVSRHIPYEYMGECNCGRQKFYEYRRELCRRVAEEMGMVASFEAPQSQNSESAPFGHL